MNIMTIENHSRFDKDQKRYLLHNDNQNFFVYFDEYQVFSLDTVKNTVKIMVIAQKLFESSFNFREIQS